MSYRKLFWQGYELFWNNKLLWVFGLLTVLEFLLSQFASDARLFTTPPQINIVQEKIVAQFLPTILSPLTAIGEVCLINGFLLAQTKKPFSLKLIWGNSRTCFFRVTLLSFIGFLISLVLSFDYSFWGQLLWGLFNSATICIVVPFQLMFLLAALILLMAGHYAKFAIVLEGFSVIEGLRRGWKIFKANKASTIWIGVVTLILASLLPLVLYSIFNVGSINSFSNPLLSTGYKIVASATGGLREMWMIAVWTLAYQQFAKKQPISKRKASK